ncbi:Thiol-disulfide isomerase or thioredoxin [Pedobacter steynii]|uniref:Thiol-disulfide isomerase or thioredoxin n=1 Tax=Pedobacter steynii TaxID=430522 RepID=A0A1G9MY77_9SPHI|nr:TlpA disulfide reductase family protein [Pedobacter steynii]NQX39462.1 redoxin domain-containing protein [Pedobacter steynii]SDL79179.1 Thiol-disulfide isomerase or thioredoxin [Pedobacter steynii]
MMKKLLVLTFLFFATCSLYAQTTKVSGSIKGYTQAKIYLSILNGPKLIKDSAIVTAGNFEFILDINEPLVARLITRDPGKRITDKISHFTSYAPVIQFFITPQVPVKIEANYAEWPISIITGGLDNQLQTSYYLNNKSTLLQEEKAFKETIALKNIGDTLKAKHIDSIRLQHSITNTDAYAQLVKENPTSLLRAFDVYEALPFTTNEEFLGKAIAALPRTIKNGVYGRDIQKRYHELTDSGLGTTVKSFKVNGKDSLIHIAAFRGKYVLLDFWGSWCVPCREGHPKLKKLYASYKDKGFEIIAIALERGKNPRQDWLKAIKDDDIPWINILNNEAITKNRQDLISLFSIKSYPTKILIGPDGKVLLRTQGNNEEIEEILKKTML